MGGGGVNAYGQPDRKISAFFYDCPQHHHLDHNHLGNDLDVDKDQINRQDGSWKELNLVVHLLRPHP